MRQVFLPSYEHRPSATQIAMRHGDDARTNSVQIKTDVLRATVSLSADKCFAGQELGVTLEVSIEPGWHIYGAPLPKAYQAMVLEFKGLLIGDYSLDMPSAKPVLLQALGETVPVYECEIRARGKLGVRWSAPIPAKFLQSQGAPIEPGLHHIEGSFRFQACSDRVCEAPEPSNFSCRSQSRLDFPAPPKK